MLCFKEMIDPESIIEVLEAALNLQAIDNLTIQIIHINDEKYSLHDLALLIDRIK